MSMSIKASPDGTYGEILVNGAVVAKLPVTGNAVIPGLVGTVSQSGGVPTGAVVERGSNAIGEYVRFADGTQICRGSIALGGGGWTTTALGFRYSGGYTANLAAVFADTPTILFNPADADVASRSAWVSFADANTVQITNAFLSATAGSTGVTASSFRYTAIGRWY